MSPRITVLGAGFGGMAEGGWVPELFGSSRKARWFGL